MKKFQASGMAQLLTLFLSSWLLSAQAGENEIRESLQSKMPGSGKIEHVVKTPYSGLYEVIINDQLLYTDEQGQYLFEGSIFDMKSRRDVTEERRRVLFAIDFDKLPLDIAMKKVKGDGKRKMAYFSDPSCGFCKRLEGELKKIDNVTLYMFVAPIFSPQSADIVRNVRCAKDPLKAWDDLMLNGIQPASASCSTKTEQILALSKKLRVHGTPNLIFGDGTQVPGYLPVEELEKRLDANGNKK